MTTLRSMAEQIMRILAGGDVPDDFRYDERDFIKAIGQLYGEAIAAKLEQRFRDDPHAVTPDLLTIYKNREIQTDEELDMKFIALPADYHTLPYDKGIWYIGPQKGLQKGYKRIHNGGQDLYADLEAGNLNGHTGYMIEGDRVYFPKNPPKDDCKVLLKMVVKADDVDPNAKLPIPSDMEAYIIRGVVAQYAPGMGVDPDFENNSVDE